MIELPIVQQQLNKLITKAMNVITLNPLHLQSPNNKQAEGAKQTAHVKMVISTNHEYH